MERLSRDYDSTSVLLRGQFDVSWKILPTLARPHRFAGRELKFDVDDEKHFLQHFRRRAYAHFGRVLTQWEVYLLARQHGLPVRLLDWTGNPLMALYCAVQDPSYWASSQKVDGAVWALVRRPEIVNPVNVFADESSPDEVTGIKIIYPPDVSPRLIAQGGVYTFQHFFGRPLEEYSTMEFDETHLDLVALQRWRVIADNKWELLRQLQRANVNRRTMFPDLDGLATGLWQDEFFRTLT